MTKTIYPSTYLVCRPGGINIFLKITGFKPTPYTEFNVILQESLLTVVSYKTEFFFLKSNLKDLDPSQRMDLDLFEIVSDEKTQFHG